MSILPPLDRSLLGEVFKDPRLIAQFEQAWELLDQAAQSAAAVTGSSGAIQSAPVLLASSSDAFSDARVLQGGRGIDVADADGRVTVRVSDDVPHVEGSRAVRFLVTADTTLLLPTAGRLATVAEVEGTVATMADGDKGDIVVSGSGTVFTIDAGVLSAFGRTMTVAADAAAARGVIGAAAASHTHIIADVTGLQAALDAKLDDTQATAAGLSMLGAADAQAQRVLLHNGGLAVKSANQTGINFTAGHNVTWDSETFDDGGWHSTATDTERMTVPSGVTRVALGASIRLANVTASTPVTVTILKNGATAVAMMTTMTSSATPAVNVSGVDACVAGDYYLVNVFVNDASADITAAGSQFWIEAR